MEIKFTELDKIKANTTTHILVEKFIASNSIKYKEEITALNTLLLQVHELKRAKLYYGRKITEQAKELEELREETKKQAEIIENFKRGL